MNILKLLKELFIRITGLDIVIRQDDKLIYMAATSLLHLKLSHEKYDNPKRLSKYGFKVHSQADEDGFIHEIYRRIGYRDKIFIEIGVSNGLECNTLFLLRQGWRGVWVDSDPDYCMEIRTRFNKELNSGDLVLKEIFINLENTRSVFDESFDTQIIDLLSIDVDSNDYYLCQSLLKLCRPRVVVLEYNATFPPPIEWEVEYFVDRRWNGTDHYGASLKSYELMMRRSGYLLVGCNMSGVNAFFVRDDIFGEYFCSDTSAEFHYEPLRTWMTEAWRAEYKKER